MKELIWEVVNSPAFITIVGSLVLYGLNKLYAKKPTWQKYQGSIIKFVKEVEKAIPDETPNAGLRRFDQVLQYLVRVFADVEGRQPNAAEVAELKEGIVLVHAELEGKEQL